MTLLIRGGQVLDGTRMALDRADLLVEGDRIVALGPNLAAPAGTREIDATGHLVVPGLVNAHTHTHNNLARGLGDNWTLEQLRNHGPALYGQRTLDEQYLSAAIGAVEMLKTGCTTAYDQFGANPVRGTVASSGNAMSLEVIEAVVQAFTDVGLRAVLAPLVVDMTFHPTIPGLLDLLPADLRGRVERIEAASPEDLLPAIEQALRRWNGSAGGRIRMGIAPAIPGQCSDGFFAACWRLAREYGVSLQTHLCETKVQAVWAVQRWGKTATAHLAEMGLLGPGFIGGHGVWLTQEDIQLLADAGAAIVHNPASNLKLGSGIAPVREMLDAGVSVGLACDGSISSDNQNMYEAMRFASLLSKVRFPHRSDRWLGARETFEMATLGSARLLGLADEVGLLAPGRKADIVLLRADSPFLRPLNNVVNQLVYAETGADVDTVLVDGHIVLEHGRVVTVDEASLRASAQRAVDRLREENAPNWDFTRRLEPYVLKACDAVVATPFPVNRYAVPIPGEARIAPSEG